MDKIGAFGKNISATITPFATRTQQMIKERMGQADEKTELPPDYLELEKRVDALKAVHQKLLSVTYVYHFPAPSISLDIAPNTRTKPTTTHPTFANLLTTSAAPSQKRSLSSPTHPPPPRLKPPSPLHSPPSRSQKPSTMPSPAQPSLAHNPLMRPILAPRKIRSPRHSRSTHSPRRR